MARSNEIATDSSLSDSNANSFKDNYEPILSLSQPGNPKQFEDDVPDKILGYLPNQTNFIGYLGEYTNYDLFKYYSLGLAYEDNLRTKDKDVAAYEFIEWCTDRAGMNPFTASTSVNSNMTLYAKWLTKYPEDVNGSEEWHGYTITFDPNAPSGETVEHMPGIETDTTTGEGESAVTVKEYLVSGISKHGKISAPDNKPVCSNYLFIGWYTDKKGKNAYDFSKSDITDNLTLYAGWEKITDAAALTKYRFSLDANSTMLPSGAIVTMPVETSFGDVAVNGKQYTEGSVSDVAITDSHNNPVCTSHPNYTFAGWYLDHACTYRFEFVPEMMEKLDSSKTTYLYAKWILNDPNDPSSRPQYIVSFDGNKPSTALADPVGLTNATVYCGDFLPADARPEVTLAGNIDQKVKNYNVQVITVTPRDFNSTYWDDNKGLIDRADLIVINETCESDMISLCNTYHSGSDSWYTDHHASGNNVRSFAKNDLSWNAVQKIYSRITGVEYNSTQKQNVKIASGTCPVLFDYNVYKSAISSANNDYYDADVRFSRGFSGGGTITIGKDSDKKAGYSSNLYKLYLLTQQASPLTLYNAFFTNKFTNYSITANANGKGSLPSGYFNSNTDAEAYWNEYTLIPFDVISSSEWGSTEADHKAALDVIGFTRDVRRQEVRSRTVCSSITVMRPEMMRITPGISSVIT